MDKEHERKDGKGIFFTIQRYGGTMKVTALDSETHEEVSIIAPVRCNLEDAKKLAIRKLFYKIRKQ